MSIIKIKPISLYQVSLYPQDFNSNNHWSNCGRPDDYEYILSKSKTFNWVDLFHKDYPIVEIDKKDLEWMIQAYKIGRCTGIFPKSYVKELEDMLDRYQHVEEIFKRSKGYFIRTEDVSLKYGQHGTGPYKDFKSVVESLVTSIHTHTPIREDTIMIKLYFLPWLNHMHKDTEFRVFVFNNKITAISQQRWYTKNKLLKGVDSDALSTMIKQILDYHENVISKRITHAKNYSMDLAVLNPLTNQSQIYFIEINSFGKEYAAGSSLFHWLTDEDILYSDGTIVEFRYVINQ